MVTDPQQPSGKSSEVKGSENSRTGALFSVMLNLYYFWVVCNFNGLNIGV